MTDLVKPSLEKAWPAAAHLIARWIERSERIDALLEALPGSMTAAERARCRHLVFGVVRHAGRIEAALGRLIAHPPRFITRAALYVAGFELIETVASGRDSAAGGDSVAGGDSGAVPRIGHHAVEQVKRLASPAEARMVNAVVRKLAAGFETERVPDRLAPAADLARYFSHPEWLVRRWLVTFGAAPTRKLLEWNQTPAPLYARWRDPGRPRPEWLRPTVWPGFLEVPTGRWADLEPLLRSGSVYLQDPGAARAVALLAPKPGETVLDLCAAPGGKSLQIADAMGDGRLAAWDLPGVRIDRLKENLARVAGVEVTLVEGDLFAGGAAILEARQLPPSFAAVLLDVPCTNTGVMRHRVDVKWRLQEADFAKHARSQRTLLSAAARLVAPGGRLVYSTCSVDPVENEEVVEAFLRGHKLFILEAQDLTRPWEADHDGSAAFRLRRSGAI